MLLLIACSLGLQGVPVELVRDLNTVPVPNVAGPEESRGFTEFGTGVLLIGQPPGVFAHTLWFAEEAQPAVRLLDFTDATPSRIAAVSNGLALVNGKVDPSSPSAMHRTDGTTAGTFELFEDGISESFEVLDGPITAGGRAWWTADLGNSLVTLWSSDGTQAGTQGEFSFDPGPPPVSNKGRLFTAGGKVFLSSRIDSQVRLASIAGPGAQPVDLGPLDNGVGFPLTQGIEFQDELWFVAAGPGGEGAELWHSDGTTAGTELAHELAPGADSSSLRLVAANDTELFFFGVSPAVSPQQFWVTDGTPTGLQALVVLAPAQAPAAEGRLGAILGDGRVVFGAGASDDALVWVSDGTPGGTLPLQPGASLGLPGQFSRARNFVAAGGKAYFRMVGGSLNENLYATDGTEQGTELLPASLSPAGVLQAQPFESALGRAFFSARVVGAEDSQVWSSLGTFQTTGPFQPLAPGPATFSGIGPGSVTGPRRSGDRFYFTATTGITTLGFPTDTELWTTDATEAGTFRVIDLVPGAASGIPTSLGEVAGRLVFRGFTPATGFELWSTDGSPEGTGLLADLEPGPLGPDVSLLEVVGDGAFTFISNSASLGPLVRTDGTPGGTLALTPPGWPSSAVSYPSRAALGGRLFFGEVDSDADSGQIWVSDGTLAGTGELFPAGLVTEGQAPLNLTRAGDYVYYSALGPVGRELYRTDGTAAGTGLVADLVPGIEGSFPAGLAAAGERLFFRAVGGSFGSEVLFVSDGTAAGTLPVHELAPGLPEFEVGLISVVGERAVLLDAQTQENELWITDGTAAGTHPIFAPINEPSFDVQSAVAHALGNSEQIVFVAETLDAGLELWRWQGPGLEPERLTDLMPGPDDSSPLVFGELDGRLLFSANHPLYGRELFAIRLADLGLAGGEPFGTACSFGQPPVIGVEGEATLGAALMLQLADAAPGVPALAFYGLGGETQPFTPGCAIYMAEPRLVGSALADAEGRATLVAGLPDDPALIGVDLTFQWLVSEPGGPVLGAFATSGAYELFVAP